MKIPFNVGDTIEGFNTIHSLMDCGFKHWVDLKVIKVDGEEMTLLLTAESGNASLPYSWEDDMIFTVKYTESNHNNFRQKYYSYDTLNYLITKSEIN